MQLKLKNIIKENELIMYMLSICKGLVCSLTRKSIIDINYGYSTFHIHHAGKINKQKIVYYISLDLQSGFCVLYKNLLKYLWFSDQYGFIPVVEFSKNIKYAEKEDVFGIRNPFEYYFEQPMEISCYDALRSYNLVYSKPQDLNYFSSSIGYAISDEDISLLADVHSKYIKFNPNILAEFDAEIGNLFKQKRILGVHVRGTDFKKNYKNHPVYIPAESYLSKVIEEYNKNSYDVIFLATDDNEVMELFKRTFGSRLIYFSCERSCNDQAVHFKTNESINVNYRRGKEVLRDVYALAKCKSLICGRSNVSVMARIVNQSLFKKFDICTILDYGLNVKGKTLR